MLERNVFLAKYFFTGLLWKDFGLECWGKLMMIGSERGQRDERTWLYLTLVPLDTHAHFIRHQPDVFSKTF